VIGSVAGALLIAFGIFMCYLKRTAIVEWLLWKLGNFRFNSLQVGTTDKNKTYFVAYFVSRYVCIVSGAA